MIDLNGMTQALRRSPCRTAWWSAKDSDASVLPPPIDVNKLGPVPDGIHECIAGVKIEQLHESL